ncbi:hypothetical protein NXY00_00505 [Bacteroides sp. BFG-551]|nr:hypothetical protein [Bacteroides sp. BFG-551]
MNRIFLLILVSIFTVSTASAQTTFLKKLKKGEKQTVVFYGASAAINTSNRAWVDQLRTATRTQIPRKDNVLQLLEVGNRLFPGN